MNIAIRLFAGYFLLVGIAAWFILSIFRQEVDPGIRQGTEETLVDSANILAELAAPELAASFFDGKTPRNRIATGEFAKAVRAASLRSPEAKIYGVNKTSVDFRVYVTDARGIVRFDTQPDTLGADYSQWRDVALVLRGEYGARSTRSDPTDPSSSVMYVAAPILHEGKLIGALAVAKPSATIRPYAQRAEERIRRAGMLLIGISSLIGLLFTFWLAWSINRLRNYALAVAEGRKALPPTHGGRQFSELAQALAQMRARLDGKQYVETYVQNLAHEMKSPLTAISGAAELLHEDLPAIDREKFIGSISDQTRRLKEIIDRMLQLAHLEQLQTPGSSETIPLTDLLVEIERERMLVLQSVQIEFTVTVDTKLTVRGDRLLIKQALLNLLDNAISFSPIGGRIEIVTHSDGYQIYIEVRDMGSGAPAYALPHLFDRFYSLPRPSGGEKSTGLGLALVREIARLHGGEAGFRNSANGGAIAHIVLPL